MANSLIHGVSIHYEEEGSGEPLVFVHGLGGCLDNWSNQAREFCSAYQVIRLDLRGFGKSDCPASDDAYSVPIFSDDLVGLVDFLGLKTVHLVGTSMGGYVAQWFALSHPERLKSLTLCHTSCRRNVPPDILSARLRALEKTDMKEYARLVVSQALAQGASQELVDSLVELVSRNSKEAYVRVISKGLTGFDVCRDLHAVMVPMLVIGGAMDQVIPADRSVEIHQQVAGSRLEIIPNVGHLSYLERPKEFNRVLMAFLMTLPSG